jgi:hypothetical protein
MISEITKQRNQYGEHWQYDQDVKELAEILHRAKFLRKKIKHYER